MPNSINVVPAVDFRTLRIANPNTILVIKNGKTIDAMTPEAMIELARAMLGQAQKAKELRPKEAEKIAFDSALLLRAGANIGLSNNPKILDMAKTEAVHNRDLRRYMPGGVKSTSVVGTPGLIKHEPQEK